MDKISLAADGVLTAWIAVVGVVFYGGYFFPERFGVLTDKAAIVYAAMVFMTICIIAWRYLNRSGATKSSNATAVSGKRQS